MSIYNILNFIKAKKDEDCILLVKNEYNFIDYIYALII